MRGHLQTEFADIPPVEVGGGARAPGAKRGHLALDYTCMKWVQLSSKVSIAPEFSSFYGWCCGTVCLSCARVFALQKKRKAGSSLLVLGTGSGDVLALDVAAGQWKWRVTDCHPGYVWCFHGNSWLHLLNYTPSSLNP